MYVFSYYDDCDFDIWCIYFLKEKILLDDCWFLFITRNGYKFFHVLITWGWRRLHTIHGSSSTSLYTKPLVIYSLTTLSIKCQIYFHQTNLRYWFVALYSFENFFYIWKFRKLLKHINQKYYCRLFKSLNTVSSRVWFIHYLLSYNNK